MRHVCCVCRVTRRGINFNYLSGRIICIGYARVFVLRENKIYINFLWSVLGGEKQLLAALGLCVAASRTLSLLLAGQTEGRVPASLNHSQHPLAHKYRVRGEEKRGPLCLFFVHVFL